MIRRHVVLDQAAADATALWIAHTHAIDAAYVTPRLAITSPEKRCGKTTLLSVLCPVVARPLSAANITPATVFRAIDAVRPCLLVDEADTFFGQAEELRGIINAGHCRATATVLRTVDTPEGFEVREFSVWGPVAIAATRLSTGAAAVTSSFLISLVLETGPPRGQRFPGDGDSRTPGPRCRPADQGGRAVPIHPFAAALARSSVRLRHQAKHPASSFGPRLPHDHRAGGDVVARQSRVAAAE